MRGALRLNFLFHWSSLRSKLESRFERGALNDEQPKILPYRNPCGLGGRRKTALGWSNARPGPRPANDRPSCDAGETAAAKPDFRIWRDQNKVRGRLIGLGNGVVVARLNKDGLPE